MAGAVNTIGQSKRGGGDRSSRPAQLRARENEQKALSLWIKGATFQQIAAAGFGIATASGAWRAVHRALARIPKQEADQAREAQLIRLQAVRMLLWNQASADPIRAAEALIKLEAREARLLGLDMPTKLAVTEPEGDGIPLEAIRRVMDPQLEARRGFYVNAGAGVASDAPVQAWLCLRRRSCGHSRSAELCESRAKVGEI